MEAAERKLWIDWRNGVETAREQLVEKYLPVAKRLAASIYASRPTNNIDFGDYLHLAYVGLLEAMQRYRHDSEAQFATYATYRIRGSILNGLPQMTEVGNHINYMKQLRRDRIRSLAAEGVPKENFKAMLDMIVNLALTVQLDTLTLEPSTESEAVSPYASFMYEELQSRLKDVLALLPPREQNIINWHYFQQISFEEIAVMLGLTKGRISQLHKRSLETIRQALQEQRLTELY